MNLLLHRSCKSCRRSSPMSSVPSPPVAPPPCQLVAPAPLPPQHGGSEIRPLDCNLASLCEHIQAEGFGAGEFSDVTVEAMGSTYRLHRLILSRSAYFRNMLHGPWKEAGAPTVVLHLDDPNVNSEAISTALGYLYGQPPKLNDNNAFRVLAAASFLDLQDLCAICTDFIISELWTSNFLQYQVFAESQDYGIHGERVRNACWGYLCQSATMELREVLPKLSSHTLHALITSDELWVPNEEKRYELALYTLIAKGAISEEEEGSCSNMELSNIDSSNRKGKSVINNSSTDNLIQAELLQLHIQDSLGHRTSQSQTSLIDIADCASEFPSGVPFSNAVLGDVNTTYNKRKEKESAMVGPSPSVESTCFKFNESIWPREESSSVKPSSATVPNNIPLWGGRTVGRRQVKNSNSKGNSLPTDEYEAFINIFEGGSLLYCSMSFEALLNVRKQLEELGFPCKALNDGLWLQMLLCHRVQAVVADTCRNCCLTSNSCACRQTYTYSHTGNGSLSYYRQDHDRSDRSGSPVNNLSNIYLSDAQSDGTATAGLFGPARVHVRGTPASDGLAGIGRGSSNSVPGAAPAWPPTRYVFSRVPVGLGARNNYQQSPGNEESENNARVADHNGDVSGDGLTVLVGLTGQSERIYEPSMQCRSGGALVQVIDSREESGFGSEWGDVSEEMSSISLDMKTPLGHFPPFRFGVEFEDVHRLTDGQVKHSSELFYAGSLWKVSVQAFNDEDPQGRRTLGLFLHRRKAEMTDPLRKAHMFIDSREKVTARYQLICPSKREVMVFGSLKQVGTLLPKAPKGWGWRTALLFDELADLLQGGSLRIAAIVQLV